MFPSKGKAGLRLKAMNGMMKGPPAMKLGKKPQHAAPGGPASMDEGAAELPGQEEQDPHAHGMEQMMVSPEEKQMIMEMRGQHPGSGGGKPPAQDGLGGMGA